MSVKDVMINSAKASIANWYSKRQMHQQSKVNKPANYTMAVFNSYDEELVPYSLPEIKRSFSEVPVEPVKRVFCEDDKWNLAFGRDLPTLYKNNQNRTYTLETTGAKGESVALPIDKSLLPYVVAIMQSVKIIDFQKLGAEGKLNLFDQLTELPPEFFGGVNEQDNEFVAKAFSLVFTLIKDNSLYCSKKAIEFENHSSSFIRRLFNKNENINLTEDELKDKINFVDSTAKEFSEDFGTVFVAFRKLMNDYHNQNPISTSGGMMADIEIDNEKDSYER